MALDQYELIRQYLQDAFTQALLQPNLKVIAENKNRDFSGDWHEDIQSSIISFSHDAMNGTLVIGCDDEFLNLTCPLLDKVSADQKDSALQDWLGELTNLTMGRIKNTLLVHDISLRVTPPSVARLPMSVVRSYAKRHPSQLIWFTLGEARIFVQFSATMAEHALSSDRVIDAKGRFAKLGDVVYLNGKQDESKRENNNNDSSNRMLAMGEFEGLGWITEQKIALTFSSGAKVHIDLTRFENRLTRSLTIADLAIDIEKKANGYQFAIDGFSIFLPAA